MKANSVKVTETIENYLESIYNMRDEGKQVIGARLAERLGVKPPTVSQTLRRMERDRLIKIESNEIWLTKLGTEVAEATIRRHRLVERFMTDFLGIGWAEAHREAEKLQHAMSDLIEQKMAEALGHLNPARTATRFPASGRRSCRPMRSRSTRRMRARGWPCCASPRKANATRACSIIFSGATWCLARMRPSKRLRRGAA